jgi:hypothetical protein
VGVLSEYFVFETFECAPYESQTILCASNNFSCLNFKKDKI